MHILRRKQFFLRYSKRAAIQLDGVWKFFIAQFFSKTKNTDSLTASSQLSFSLEHLGLSNKFAILRDDSIFHDWLMALKSFAETGYSFLELKL